eukprot:3525569-Rhodomonas_salina.1
MVLLHISYEIGKRFDLMSEVENQDFDLVEVAFAKFLLKASLDSTLIIILDGLDRITVNGRRTLDLDWFPLTLPIRCRFVLSLEEGSLLNVFRRARVQVAGRNPFISAVRCMSCADLDCAAARSCRAA